MTGPADWTAVKGVLSLGLGRQPLPHVEGFDAAGLEDADMALALLSLLGQRVRLSPPPRLSSPKTQGLPDDPRPMLPPAARDALQRLDRRLDADTRRRLAPILTAAVTGAGCRFHIFDLPALEPMLRVSGDLLGPVERAWLLAGRDIAPADQADGEEAAPASAAERLRAFRRARRLDPAGARSDLTAAMTSTPAKLRADLVASLSIGLAAEDGPLLETSLGDRAQGVREAAKSLLGRLPGSAAYEERLTQARASLTLETKGLLKRQSRLVFRPPGKLVEDRAAAFALFDGFGLGVLLQGLGPAAGDVVEMIGGDALTVGLLARAAIMDGDHGLAGRLLRRIAEPAWPGDLLSLPLDAAMLEPAARSALVAAAFQPGAQLSWGYSLFQLGEFLGGALEPSLAAQLLVAPALLDRLASLTDQAAVETKGDLDLQLLPLAALLPPEADSVAHFAASPHMKPPLALLVHARDRAGLASFYPMAEFSPEWVALRWALGRERATRFIDLPMTHTLALRAAKEDATLDREAADGVETDGAEAAPDPSRRGDPLDELAAVAGYADGEAWWNSLIEERVHPEALFAAIETAMTAVRDRVDAETDPASDEAVRETLREAHMRLAIRDGLDACGGEVAVVVGAWHTPALRRRVPLKDDRARLKGLPKIDVSVTWTPWTDARLARASGYGAGVVSPGWYRHLWTALQGRETLDTRAMAVGWQTGVAGLLRREGLAASTAAVIEAVRLAESLTALRGRGAPGLAELNEASLATLCHGDDAPLRLIEQRLVIGSRLGAVDEAVPRMPLLADLARQQKRLRLRPEATESEIGLDLRTEAGLAKSVLLHRLLLIQVPWGRLTDAGGSRGTFRERWRLAWDPELAVALAEALRWGTTIEDAAAEAASERATDQTDAAALAGLVRATLLADLPAVAERCINRLQAVSARSGDLIGLMRATPPLADTLRYGEARRIPEAPLRRLIETMVEETCVGLGLACRQLDDAGAAAMLSAAAGLHEALPLLDQPALQADWRRALKGLVEDDAVAGRLRGFAVRKLYDAGDGDLGATAARLSRALSPSVAPAQAAAWLEGFLDDAGRLLLHDAPLLGLLDDWVLALDPADLETLLPQLRRAFSGLDAMERRRLLAAATQPGATLTAGLRATDGPEDDTPFQAALPLLKTILGLVP